MQNWQKLQNTIASTLRLNPGASVTIQMFDLSLRAPKNEQQNVSSRPRNKQEMK